jgi:hypothetical protein
MRVAARTAAACLAALALLAAPSSALALKFFGFNDDWAPATVKRTVALSRKFRANSERMIVYWGSTEPRKNRFDWYGLDVAYQTMLQQHVRPLFDVVSAPKWAVARGCRPLYKCQQTASHDHDYRVFLAALTKRYPHATGIEVGQEPNLTNWSVHPDPRRYSQILKSAWTAVKNANRHMTVVLGSTCCTYAFSHGNIGAGVFLQQLYRYGIKGHYNAIGFHVYPGGPISRVASDIVSEVSIMRAIRNANHDGSPFWITETGFPSQGFGRYGAGRNTESTQSQRELTAYRTLIHMRDVVALYFYRLIDPRHPIAFANFQLGMGFYKANYHPKLAARTLIHARTGH